MCLARFPPTSASTPKRCSRSIPALPRRCGCGSAGLASSTSWLRRSSRRRSCGTRSRPSSAPAAAIEPIKSEPTPSAETPPPETPAAEAPPLIMADEPGADSIPVPPPVGELPEEVSDSIAASLAKSLIEPSEEHIERVAAPPVIPPEVEPKVERSANVVQLARRVSRWRRMTVVMGAIAALLALYIGLAQFAPGLVPLGPRAPVVAQSQAPAQLAARLVAVLQQEPTAPAFLLAVDPQSRTMVVRRVSATPEAGRSYELWLISSQFPTPRSLGV